MRWCYEEYMNKKEGYSLEEVKVLTDKMIDKSVERLRKRLRTVRKKREYAMMVSMKKKKIPKKQDGYSPQEMDVHMRAYIKRSAEQLRKELRTAWKKRGVRRRLYHGVTV